MTALGYFSGERFCLLEEADRVDLPWAAGEAVEGPCGC